MFNRACLIFIYSLSLFYSHLTHSGVIVYGTRFIVDSSSKQASVVVENTSDNIYLINVEIRNNVEGGSELINFNNPDLPEEKTVIVSPNIFVLKGNKSVQFRVQCVQCELLPNDRETAYYLSVSAIPRGKPSEHDVQLATRSTFKLFYRPSAINKSDSSSAYKKLKLINEHGFLNVYNPTPYYITMTPLTINYINDISGVMIPPYSSKKYPWCSKSFKTKDCNVKWGSIDDFGKQLPVISKSVF